MKTIRGVGYAVKGHEEDYLCFVGKNNTLVSITDFAPDTIDPYIGNIMILEKVRKGRCYEKGHDKEIKKWRRKNKRKFPKLYRFKISCEVEQLPDAESDAYWLGQQKIMKKAHEERLNKENKNEGF